MNQQTFNPYVDIGNATKAGIISVIAYLNTLTPPVAVSDVVDGVTDYIANTYYGGGPTTQQLTELNSIAYNAINSYNSNLVLQGNAMYNAKQMAFIQLLIGAGMTANTAPASVGDAINEIQDNIGTSDLTVNEQTPLFLAATVGTAAFDYWSGIIVTPGPWSSYINIANNGKNYMNSLIWVVAAMNGALAAYGSSVTGMVEPTTAMVSNQLISALIGAITVTVGKVIFNWSPRIVKPLTLNLSQISNLNTNVNNPRPTNPPAMDKSTTYQPTPIQTQGCCNSGGCTDGCGTIATWWNCTHQNCTKDCIGW